jgi:peptidyl-lysine (3S)-dioxygenase / protease
MSKNSLEQVFIVRHGERLDSVDVSWKSSALRPHDPPLTSRGVIQARSAGCVIAQQVLDVVSCAENWACTLSDSKSTNAVSAVLGKHVNIRLFTSPFLRCVQTARALLAEMIPLLEIQHNETKLEYSVQLAVEDGACEFICEKYFEEQPQPLALLEIAKLLAPFPVDGACMPACVFPKYPEPIDSCISRYTQTLEYHTEVPQVPNTCYISIFVTHGYGCQVMAETLNQDASAGMVIETPYACISSFSRVIEHGGNDGFGSIETVVDDQSSTPWKMHLLADARHIHPVIASSIPSVEPDLPDRLSSIFNNIDDVVIASTDDESSSAIVDPEAANQKAYTDFMDTTSDWHFDTLSSNVGDLCVPNQIERISASELTPLRFYREYVAMSRPVIITDAILHWPALRKWTNDYLISTLGDSKVTVAITPDGRADSVIDGRFMLPLEEQMTFAAFLDGIAEQSPDCIMYAQKQNNSLVDEYSKLLDDVEELKFAREAFGQEPDAVNFWFGENRTVSSMHQDPYENMYCVVAGAKHFTLVPPTDRFFLGYEEFPVYRWTKSASGSLVAEVDDSIESVDWIPIDVEDDERDVHRRLQFPACKIEKLHRLRVQVHAGETLYLPATWYHRVAQQGDADGRTIAVNYWYDMQFGFNYCYSQFMNQMIQVRRGAAAAEHQEATGK